MTSLFGRQHRLAQRGGAGLVCDEAGLALGCVTLAAIEEDAGAGRRYRVKPADEISRALRLAYDAQPETTERYSAGLQRVVALLEAGETGRAGVQAVLLGLPKISPKGMAKLAAAADLRRGGNSWRDQPRISAGQDGAGEWASTGGGGDARFESATERQNSLEAKKAGFVKSYLGYAQAAALKLSVPVENTLGVSALESNWGDSRFAKSANNFFGMYSPAPRSHRSISAIDRPNPEKRPVLLAAYDSIQDSFMSFADKYADILKNKRDAIEFATALQKQAKFGIDTKTGNPKPGYIPSVAATIKGLRPFIADRKI